MSIYLRLDEQEAADWCSNTGYNDFCRWVDSLDGQYVELAALRDNGLSEQLPTLAEEITAATAESPPDKDTLAVAGELRSFIDDEGDAVLTITDGLVPDDPEPTELIALPDIRQPNHFSCGAASSMACGRYFGVGPETIEEWETALGTTEEKSTSPQAIIEYLASLGLQVTAQDNMTLDDLADCWRAGTPVICPCQDYMPERPARAEWDYGHYLSFIGGPTLGRVFFQDSSEDNVTEGSGTIAVPGQVAIAVDRWLSLWHDIGEDGTKYVRYGIIVGPKAATEKAAPVEWSEYT